MQVMLPSPQTTLIILLGASEWPLSPDLHGSARAFLNAAHDIRTYFLSQDGFNLPEKNLLNLFDDEDSAPNLLRRISQWLQQEKDIAKDLLVYFIGHGGITTQTSSFYLTIRQTEKDYEEGTSIAIDNLAERLKKGAARELRRILVLDCCFAAAAVKYFQGTTAMSIATSKTFNAFKEQDKNEGPLPGRGTSFLCSSSKDKVSHLLPDLSSTMFTHALLEVLRTGSSSYKGPLSLHTIHRFTLDFLEKQYPGQFTAPEVHSPDQSEGKVEDVPLFPNFAVLKKPVIAPPIDTYRRAVVEAWAGEKLDEAKLARLTRLTSDLGLSKEQVALIEREVMSDTKQAIWSRQVTCEHQDQYRREVEAAWANNRLDEAKVAHLKTLANGFGLRKKQIDTIERDLMGDIKEVIWAHQHILGALNFRAQILREQAQLKAQQREESPREAELALESQYEQREAHEDRVPSQVSSQRKSSQRKSRTSAKPAPYYKDALSGYDDAIKEAIRTMTSGGSSSKVVELIQAKGDFISRQGGDPQEAARSYDDAIKEAIRTMTSGGSSKVVELIQAKANFVARHGGNFQKTALSSFDDAILKAGGRNQVLFNGVRILVELIQAKANFVAQHGGDLQETALRSFDDAMLNNVNSGDARTYGSETLIGLAEAKANFAARLGGDLQEAALRSFDDTILKLSGRVDRAILRDLIKAQTSFAVRQLPDKKD